MNLTAKTLVPAIVMGGTVLGLLAATDINTRMNSAPEPSWRTAAREAAMNAVSYAIFDTGPSDLSPHVPWIGTGPDGSVVLFPEDLHRSQPAYGYDPLPEVEADLAYAEPELEYGSSERGDHGAQIASAEAEETATELQRGEPALAEQRSAPDEAIEPAVLDVAGPPPLFDTAAEDDRLGG